MNTAALALMLTLGAAVAPRSGVPSSTPEIRQLVVGTAPAAARPDSVSWQPARFDTSRFDIATAQTIRAILDTAAAHGIPTHTLVSLAYMGAATGKPGIQIANKVRAKYAAMLDSRVALGDNSTESELASGADALQSGVDGKALVAVRVSRPAPGSALMALVVLNDLIKRNIHVGTAGDAVLALCKSSRADDKLNGLQQLVARNADRGPGMAQDALDRYLKSNAPGYASPATSKPTTRPPGPPDAQ